MITGKIHSIQTLGTLDGPGVRFVVFMQGCNLRCHCCHNPDTWSINDGKPYTPEEIVKKAERFREYFGEKGGITLSGGEPLLQKEFAREVFSLCRKKNINTCLDTSGNILDKSVVEVLSLCDRVLLDVKYTEDDLYKKYVGCSIDNVMKFLSKLNDMKIPTTIRQVVIPTVNDYEENFINLKRIAKTHSCVDNIELLPFRKICITKYESMGIKFPFASKDEPTYEDIEKYRTLLI